MKKALLVVALLAVAFAAAPVCALTFDANALPGGPVQAKYTNFSDLYVPGANGAGANGFTPLIIGANPSIGDENRAIFNTSSIQTPSSVPLWFPVSQQLTGLFYNMSLLSVTGNPDGTTTFDFGISTRNPLTSGPGLASAPAGSGGVIEVYLDSNMDFNADPNGVGSLSLPKTIASVQGNPPVSDGTWGPASWVEGTGGASRDTYVGATEGTLWLSGVFVPFSDIGIVGHTSGTIFSETVNLTTGVGSAVGYIHLVDGSYYPAVSKGAVGFGPDVDMLLISDEALPGNDGTNLNPTANYSGVGYWPADSQDPVSFNVAGVPEPMTMTLLGLGLAGLFIRRRK